MLQVILLTYLSHGITFFIRKKICKKKVKEVKNLKIILLQLMCCEVAKNFNLPDDEKFCIFVI